MTIINTLLLCTLALCEVPPPYPQRGFRPSPQLSSQPSSSNYPQAGYEPSLRQLASLDVKVPSKLTIEQLISLTEQLQRYRGTPQAIEVSFPRNSYLPPLRQPQQTYGPPSKFQISQLRPPSASQPQLSYGPPQSPISKPKIQYGPPQSQAVPNRFQNPQKQYIPPQSPNGQAIPQTTYGVPNTEQTGSSNEQQRPQVPPATSYGVPDVRNIETFGEQHNEAILRQNLLNNLKKQRLPYWGPTGFNPEQGQSAQPQIQPSISQQYIPASGGNNVVQRPQGVPQLEGTNTPSIVPQSSGGSVPNPNVDTGIGNPNSGVGDVNNVDQKYLPPQTTPRSVFKSRATTLRPNIATTTASLDQSTNSDYDYDLQQTTEASVNQDASDSGPNVAVSTAVAVPDTYFYLRQPDGRLQKVILQKTQEPNSKPEEYVANYYFQNVQALPNTVYAPLVSLGSYVRK